VQYRGYGGDLNQVRRTLLYTGEEVSVDFEKLLDLCQLEAHM